MIEYLKKVSEFNKAYKIEEKTKPYTPKKPLITNKEEIAEAQKYVNTCHDLLEEELLEYKIALTEGDMIEVADSLGDMLYVLLGNILKHGLQDKIEDIFNEIHQSNMSKLDENGSPIYSPTGKVLKGSSFVKPDIKRILES